MKKLTDKYFSTYTAMLDVDVDKLLEQIKQREWTVESFRFYTAVSVMASSRIEGETLEIDSYLKPKTPQTMVNRATTDRTPAANSTYPKSEVSCSKDSFVVNQSLVLRINPVSYRDGENRHLQEARKRKQFILVSML